MSGPATSSVTIQPVLSLSDFISSVQNGDPDIQTDLAAYGAALGEVLEYSDNRERLTTIIKLIEAITTEFANNPEVQQHLLKNLAGLLARAEGDLRKAGIFLQGGRPKATLFAPDDKMRAQILSALAIQQKAAGRDGPSPVAIQPSSSPPAHTPILTLPWDADESIKAMSGPSGRNTDIRATQESKPEGNVKKSVPQSESDRHAVIITGAASGIGRATAIKFAQRGWNVAATDIDESRLREVYLLLSEQFGEARHIIKVYDHSDPRQSKKALGEIGEHYSGRIKAVFVNAGRHYQGSIFETTEEDWDRAMRNNLKSAFLTLRGALPFLVANGGGSVVLCGSDQSLVGKRGNFVYGATKAAIAQMAKSLAIDLADNGIRVNCVCPGTIDTPLVDSALQGAAKRYGTAPEQFRALLERAQPIKRLGRAEEVADVVYFLISDEAGFVTGANWVVDGGYTAQ